MFPKVNGPLNKDPRDGEFIRASGLCVCEVCGLIYYKHPMDHFTLGYDGEPFNNVLCDGTRVHL